MTVSPRMSSIVCWALALTGCTSLTGLDGSSSYSCKAPEGVTCDSISGVYANAIRNNLPSQQSRARTAPAAPPPAVPASAARALAGDSAEAHDELRSRPRLLRLWFKPWEDIDGDLFDQGYVYVRIDAGQWRIDHVQRRIRDRYVPVRLPARGDAPTRAAESGSSAPGMPSAAQEPRQVQRPAAPQAATD